MSSSSSSSEGKGCTTSEEGSTISLSLHQVLNELSNVDDPGAVEEAAFYWKTLVKGGGAISVAQQYIQSTNNVKDIVSLFQKCFAYSNHQAKAIICQDILASCGVEILKILSQDPSSDLTLAVTEYLLQQLIHPFNPTAKVATKDLLKSSALYMCDSIKMLLNESLVSGASNSPISEVYSVIYELLLINKHLTIGLINNCELCLSRSREDRFDGVLFLCKLFTGTDFPGLCDPALFYSHLWSKFVNHCRVIYGISMTELTILIRFTPRILRRQYLQKDWCSVLLSRLAQEYREQYEIAIVEGILKAVEEDTRILTSGNEISKLLFILLNGSIGDCNKLSDLSWKILYKGLGKLYSVLASNCLEDGAEDSPKEEASAVLKVLLSPCCDLNPLSDSWVWVQKVFVRHCLLSKTSGDKCMQMLFLAWILSEEKQCVLQRVFLRSKIATTLLRILLFELPHQNPKNKIKLIQSIPNRLASFLPYPNTAQTLLKREIVEPVETNLDLRDMLQKLVNYSETSYGDRLKIMTDLTKVIHTKDSKEEKVLSALCFTLSVTPCDKQSFNHLVHIVDTCINDESLAEDYGKSSEHFARLALLLMNEMLYTSPLLGYSDEALQHLRMWSNNRDEGISSSALRCLLIMARGPMKLQSLNPSQTNTFEKGWFLKISHGTRLEVKLAIRCLMTHLSHLPLSSCVFQIIKQLLSDTSKKDSFERGVTALGCFAPFCPPAEKIELESLAMNIVFKFIMEDFEELTGLSLTNSEIKFFVWEEFPHVSYLLIVALRSLGKCIRYCGCHSKATIVIQHMISLITEAPHKSCSEFSDVEIHRFRLEAACVILTVLECKQFYKLVSTNLLVVMSSLMTDSCVMVKEAFAEKLCRGLKPCKLHFSERGKTKGHLPPVFLGFLPLLGLNFRAGPSEQEKTATLIDEVFFSRSRTLTVVTETRGREEQEVNRKFPHLLPASTLLQAIPIVACQHFLSSSDPPDEPISFGTVTMNEDSLLQVAHGFAVVIKSLQKPSNTFQCEKSFLVSMINRARGTLKRPVSNLLFKKYLAVWEVLNLVAQNYNPDDACHLTSAYASNIFYGTTNHDRVGFTSQLTHHLKEKIKHSVGQLFSLEDPATINTTNFSETENYLDFVDSDFQFMPTVLGNKAPESDNSVEELHGEKEAQEQEGSGFDESHSSASSRLFVPGAVSSPLSQSSKIPPLTRRKHGSYNSDF